MEEQNNHSNAALMALTCCLEKLVMRSKISVKITLICLLTYSHYSNLLVLISIKQAMGFANLMIKKMLKHNAFSNPLIKGRGSYNTYF